MEDVIAVKEDPYIILSYIQLENCGLRRPPVAREAIWHANKVIQFEYWHTGIYKVSVMKDRYEQIKPVKQIKPFKIDKKILKLGILLINPVPKMNYERVFNPYSVMLLTSGLRDEIIIDTDFYSNAILY